MGYVLVQIIPLVIGNIVMPTRVLLHFFVLWFVLGIPLGPGYPVRG